MNPWDFTMLQQGQDTFPGQNAPSGWMMDPQMLEEMKRRQLLEQQADADLTVDVMQPMG